MGDVDEAMVALGKRVTEARVAAKLSMNELGRRSKVGGGNLSRLEAGNYRRPSNATITALATVLGVRPDWLATGTGPRHGPTGSGAADIPAREFLDWIYTQGGAVTRMIDRYRDVTVADLFRLRSKPAAKGELDEDALYQHTIGLRVGIGASMEAESAALEKSIAGSRAPSKTPRRLAHRGS